SDRALRSLHSRRDRAKRSFPPYSDCPGRVPSAAASHPDLVLLLDASDPAPSEQVQLAHPQRDKPYVMQALSVVLATPSTGRKLHILLRGAGGLSAAAGAPSVVVAYGRGRPRTDPAGYGDVQLILQPPGDGIGSALLAGARHAQAPRCLLVCSLPLDEALVRAHRRVPVGADVVTVGRLSPALPVGTGAPGEC